MANHLIELLKYAKSEQQLAKGLANAATSLHDFEEAVAWNYTYLAFTAIISEIEFHLERITK